MFHQEAVALTGESAESVGGEENERFRRLELFARSKGPGEVLRIDSDHGAGRSILIRFDVRRIVSAVHQEHSVGVADGFRGGGRREDKARIVLMTGRAAGAAEALTARRQRAADGLTFPGPAALKIDQVVFRTVKVNLSAHQTFHDEGGVRCVFHPDGTGNHVGILKNGVGEDKVRSGKSIGHGDFERLHFRIRSETRRQTGERFLALEDAVTPVDRRCDGRSADLAQSRRRHTLIAAAEGGEFQRNKIQRVFRAQSFRMRGEGGLPVTGSEFQNRVIIGDGGSIVEVAQFSAGTDLHEIGGSGGIQFEGAGFL